MIEAILRQYLWYFDFEPTRTGRIAFDMGKAKFEEGLNLKYLMVW